MTACHRKILYRKHGSLSGMQLLVFGGGAMAAAAGACIHAALPSQKQKKKAYILMSVIPAWMCGTCTVKLYQLLQTPPIRMGAVLMPQPYRPYQHGCTEGPRTDVASACASGDES